MAAMSATAPPTGVPSLKWTVAVGVGRLEEGTGALMYEDAAGPVDLRGEQVHPLVP